MSPFANRGDSSMSAESHATDPPLRTQESGFGGAAGFGRRPVVLVVDAVRAYLDSGSPLRLDTGAAAVSAMADLLAAARSAGIPVVYTTVSYGRGAEIDAPVFARKVPALSVFNAGSRLAEIAPEIAPVVGEPVVRKSYASAFFGTDLAARLSSMAADTVVIVGFSTSGCVRATAVDAVQHDLVAVVVADAVADTSVDRQRANLYDLNAKYADVVSLDAALDELGRRSQGFVGRES